MGKIFREFSFQSTFHILLAAILSVDDDNGARKRGAHQMVALAAPIRHTQQCVPRRANVIKPAIKTRRNTGGQRTRIQREVLPNIRLHLRAVIVQNFKKSMEFGARVVVCQVFESCLMDFCYFPNLFSLSLSLSLSLSPSSLLPLSLLSPHPPLFLLFLRQKGVICGRDRETFPAPG